MTARVSMLLKSRASLTCFRACFFPGRAKDLSAPRIVGMRRFPNEFNLFLWLDEPEGKGKLWRPKRRWKQNTNFLSKILILLFCTVWSNTRRVDKSLARPGRKQARKNVKDARDFNNIETRAVIKFFFFLQGKAPKEIHAILTEILACFLPGRPKDLSALRVYRVRAELQSANVAYFERKIRLSGFSTYLDGSPFDCTSVRNKEINRHNNCKHGPTTCAVLCY